MSSRRFACGPLRSLILDRQLPLVGAPRARRHPAVAHAGAVSAERVDCPAVLAQGSGRGTRCVRCALYAQTAAARMTTKRAARADPWAAFLGAPEIAPAGYRLPRGWVLAVRRSGPRQPERQKPGCKGVWGPLAARLLGRRGGEPRTQTVQWTVCAWRAAGPLAQRGLQGQVLRPRAQRDSSTFSSRLSERRERSERSEFRDGAQDRAPQGSRRVQRTTAPVKRRQRPPRAFAASPANTRRTDCGEARQRSRIGNHRTTVTGRKQVLKQPSLCRCYGAPQVRWSN